MVVFISDLDLTGSGYMNIAIASCNQLAQRNFKVTVLGIGYNGSEHNWPFSIIPVNQGAAFSILPSMMRNLINLGKAGKNDPVEAIVVALDIPLQDRLLRLERDHIPYIGIFPIESGPLCETWAGVINQMSERLVISRFGLKQMKEAGVDGRYIPIGIDTDSWRLPVDGEKASIRKSLGIENDEFVILTVADNQERKNLSRAAEIIAEVKKTEPGVRWILVTREHCAVGWKLQDLFVELNIHENVAIYERGIPHDRLWVLHAASDAFLLTSKAEGLCMPVLEAMASGTPVVATESAAITEHLYEDPLWDREQAGIWESPKRFGPKPKGQRGLPIYAEFYTRDAWGNSQRAFASLEHGTKQLLKLRSMSEKQRKEMVARARSYAESRDWDRAGKLLANTVQEQIEQVAPAKGVYGARAPKTVPGIVPKIVGDITNG